MTTHPDPQFPNRPDHPDFWLMSKVVTQHDDLCDTGTEEEGGFAKTIQVDIASLGYMAGQRTKRAIDLLQDNPVDGIKALPHEVGVMLWMDAFTAGQRFAQLQGDGVTASVEGNRRARRGKK